ncbi:MAG: hypothetical protein H3C31_06925 [Brumimicrobium sp.]|nr:hypothetical protein [Brumimicrobium sp.]
MNKYFLLITLIHLISSAFAQGDVEIITESDRSIAPAYRISSRPKTIDTTIYSPVVDYPYLVIQKETSFNVEEIKPATIKQRAQLTQLYNGYAKIAGGNMLMGLGEIYYNSSRSRKFNWGFHGKHLSEWGKIKKYAPAQYDISNIKAFGKVEESRYSYGGQLFYQNQGLHYYGFRNPNASKDSTLQRYQTIGFNGFFDSHRKDSAMFNYRIGVEYENFHGRKPKMDTLKDWYGRENYAALKTRWQYNATTNKLLSNLRADLDFSFNQYKYGVKGEHLINPYDSIFTALDTTYHPLDTGILSNDFIIYLRPVTSFYGVQGKLHFLIGGELALDFGSKFRASLYPLAEVKYSLFNDIFIPYAGIKGGLKQQRYGSLAGRNEFIASNVNLVNESQYEVHGGFKGTLSSSISFNTQFSYGHYRNRALFVNDTIYSSGNKFGVIYDTLNIATISASISYQKNEKLKIDAIGRFHSYETKNNPYAWNLPQFEVILRGYYNIFSKLIVRADVTLETGRYARMYDKTVEGVKMQDGIYYKKLGVLVDANLGVEYRWSKRFSIFVEFNNLAAQKYQRWYEYPVSNFQFMAGLTFRF